MKILNSVYLKNTSVLSFDTSNTVSPANAGELVWNQVDGTLDVRLYNGVTLQLGQEMYFYAKASSAITNGQVIQFVGAEGDHALAKPAVGSEVRANPTLIMGIATQDIAQGSFGYITAFGVVRDQNTNGWAEGSILYYDCTLNALSISIPTAPDPKIQMASVVRAHATTGAILVRPNTGFSISQGNDVNINSISEGQVLVWNAATSRWENQLQKASNTTLLDTAGNYDGTNVETGMAEVGAYAKIINQNTAITTGFTNSENITVSYNSTNRTITLTGTFVAYYQGKVVTELISGWVSSAHTNLAGSYYLYYNGAFVWSTTPWTFDVLHIAYVQFGTSSLGIREVHGLMQGQTHETLHFSTGTYKVSGGTFSSYVLNSSTAANRRPDISTTVVRDEDLNSNIAALTTKLYTHRYLTGAAVRTFTTSNAEIIPVSGNQPYWNQNNAGTWQQTLFNTTEYGAIFVVAVPTTADASSQLYRYVFVQPQQVGTLDEIRAVTTASLTLGDASSLILEYVFIAKIIIQYLGGNWTIIEINTLNGSRSTQVGLQAGQYLSVVETDSTLSGQGTATSPLSVVANGHAHTIANITGLQTALDAKAPLASPTFTGSLVLQDPAQYLALKVKSTHASAAPQLQLRDSAETGFDIGYDKLNATFSINKTVAGAYDSTLLAVHSDWFAYKTFTVWHSGNDGTGSTLDADLLDGKHASEFATKLTFTGTLTAASWSGASAPYTYTSTVTGIASTDTPFIDLTFSGTYATDTARVDNYAEIYRAVTSTNTITFYAHSKPTVDLPLQIMVIR